MERYQFSDQELNGLEQLPTPLVVYQFADNHVHVLAMSDGYRELFELPEREEAYRLLEQDVLMNTHPDDVERLKEAVRRFITESGRYEVIFRGKKYHGTEDHVIHGIGRHVYRENGIRLAYVSFIDEGAYTSEDDTQASALNRAFNQVLHEESILRATYYDRLTGLPGMTHFLEVAETVRKLISDEGGTAAFLYIDLNDMKNFNDSYGFAEGDRLLKAFAGLMADTFGREYSCHISADRFAAAATADGLDETLRNMFQKAKLLNGGNMLPIRAGIYLSSIEDVPVSSAYDRAKIACDLLLKSDVSAFSYYSDSMRERLKKRHYILSHFDQAIKEGWIQAYYQPIIRSVTGKVCNEEALARWIDPENGFMSPADFIPILEDAGLLYRLDLYILDCVLEKLKTQRAAGLPVVPQSINLSRTDFESCDITEEIRRRVDASGIGRDKITIELTESVIGRDFDFMKAQVERFRNLGFPVWMDDFGDGYSTLDVLQSIRFDLIKFDMRFMARLDEGEEGKVILTELMKIASGLGLDTVCEGVETVEQVRFLQTIGCSRLQGFYYCRPIPLQRILKRYADGIQIGFENPGETDYYNNIGRISLHDLSFMANADKDLFRNVFDTIPMAIMEIHSSGSHVRYVRSNRSYQDFMTRAFGLDAICSETEYPIPEEGPGSGYMKAALECARNRDRIFIDDHLPDGSFAHCFARWIARNPVTGAIALAVAVLSVEEPEKRHEYEALVQENAMLKQEADMSRKIAELTQSVSSLLTNMPAMTFSKDSATGRYLACNRLFAEYAGRKTPEEVVGLTDFEIFDCETAAHFAADDKKALAMDRPYVFYEDVLDAAGNQRQFQTTKLKFTDTQGRVCLLGMCIDVTELVNARNEAHHDELTGVGNKHAYVDLEAELNERIENGEDVKFAMVVLDVNDLKTVNDTLGHQAGDAYIVNACRMITDAFPESTVFRIGGDEFVVYVQGSDYTRIHERMEAIRRLNQEHRKSGGIVIAAGMAEYAGDRKVEDVFRRADSSMYDNKHSLKL